MWDWTFEFQRDLKIPFLKKFFIYKLRKILLKLRIWDVIASNRVDVILANSYNTASRIKKYYKKEAEVLFPPVETDRFAKNLNINSLDFLEKNKINKNDYYIIISALTEFKKIDIAIKAFNKMPDKKLIII
jgi:glycosyltransferase involved in cell wall biosynthesis